MLRVVTVEGLAGCPLGWRVRPPVRPCEIGYPDGCRVMMPGDEVEIRRPDGSVRSGTLGALILDTWEDDAGIPRILGDSHDPEMSVVVAGVVATDLVPGAEVWIETYPASDVDQSADATVPDPDELLRDTGWEGGESAFGERSTTWLPYVLRALLDSDPAVQSDAFADLEPIRHQNTVYSAAVPAATYIAGILSDPRTAAVCMFGQPRWRRDRPAPLRAELISWLGELVVDAGYDHDGASPGAAVLRLRPQFFDAIAPFLYDDDRTVRRAAATAASVLVEAPELAAHRTEVLTLASLADRGRRLPSNVAGDYVHGSSDGDPWSRDPWAQRR